MIYMIVNWRKTISYLIQVQSSQSFSQCSIKRAFSALSKPGCPGKPLSGHYDITVGKSVGKLPSFTGQILNTKLCTQMTTCFVSKRYLHTLNINVMYKSQGQIFLNWPSPWPWPWYWGQGHKKTVIGEMH